MLVDRYRLRTRARLTSNLTPSADEASNEVDKVPPRIACNFGEHRAYVRARITLRMPELVEKFTFIAL